MMERIVFQSSISAPTRLWRTQWQSWWLRNRTGQLCHGYGHTALGVASVLTLGQNVGRRSSLALILRSTNPWIPGSNSYSASACSSSTTTSSAIQSICKRPLRLRSSATWREHVRSLVRRSVTHRRPESLRTCQWPASQRPQ